MLSSALFNTLLSLSPKKRRKDDIDTATWHVKTDLVSSACDWISLKTLMIMDQQFQVTVTIISDTPEATPAGLISTATKQQYNVLRSITLSHMFVVSVTLASFRYQLLTNPCYGHLRTLQPLSCSYGPPYPNCAIFPMCQANQPLRLYSRRVM